MLISEISLWGTALIAILVFIASIVLFFIDRQMLRRMLAIFGATIAQMAVVGTVVWLVFTTNTWWSYLLCYLLILFLSICWVLYPLQAIWKKERIMFYRYISVWLRTTHKNDHYNYQKHLCHNL